MSDARPNLVEPRKFMSNASANLVEPRKLMSYARANLVKPRKSASEFKSLRIEIRGFTKLFGAKMRFGKKCMFK